MSLDGFFQSGVTWAAPIAIPYSAWMFPNASLTEDPITHKITGDWKLANQGPMNMLFATAGSKGAMADVARLHTRTANEVVAYKDAAGTTQYYTVPDTQKSPYATDTVNSDGTVEVVGGTVVVSAPLTCAGVLSGDVLTISGLSGSPGYHLFEIDITAVTGGSSPGEVSIDTPTTGDHDFTSRMCDALNAISGVTAVMSTIAPYTITVSCDYVLGLTASSGAEHRLSCGTATRVITGGSFAYSGRTITGNGVLFDPLISPDHSGGSVLDNIINELGGVGSAMAATGSITDIVDALDRGAGAAPTVSADAIAACFGTALTEINNLTGLWNTEATDALMDATNTGPTIAPITNQITAAVNANNAISVADEALVLQRLTDSYQGLRGAAFGQGFALATARLASDGVRTRTQASTGMFAGLIQAQAQQSTRQAELAMESRNAKAQLLYNKMQSRVAAMLTMGGEAAAAIPETARIAAQMAIALAGEYSRLFGIGFGNIGTKADVLQKLCQIRNLKIEHELRDKLWDVELFPYFASGVGAPGAATVKKPSGFDIMSDVVGLAANVAGTGFNIYSAIKGK